MKKLFICIALMLALGVNNSSTYAQSVVKSGKTFVATSTNKSKGEKEAPIKTGFEYQDTKGNKYPIYMTKSSGSCFIIKVSKKSGKEYRQYLGAEISQQVCKELGTTYKGKK